MDKGLNNRSGCRKKRALSPLKPEPRTAPLQVKALTLNLGVRMRGTLGDIDPLNKLPFKRARSGAQKGPLEGVSLLLPLILRPL